MSEVLTIDDMSRVHRFAVGDKVEFDPSGHDHIDAPVGAKVEGVVVEFGNVEQTYLEVDFDGHVYTLTEDEVRRLG